MKKLTFFWCRFCLFGLILLITGIIIPRSAAAQSGKNDVIHLKNGTVIKGDIVDINQGEYLRIEISEGNIFVVMLDEVSEITTEINHQQKNYKATGYMNRTGLEILSGQDNSPRLYMVNGYQFTPRISAGVGLGLTPYNDPLTLIPLFIDFNLQFLEANASPFFFLKFGYNITTHQNDDAGVTLHRGGLLFNPGFGLQFHRNNGFGWFINAGFNIDNSYYEFETWGSETVQNKLSFRRMNIGLGLSF